jgi:hypothetical protein
LRTTNTNNNNWWNGTMYKLTAGTNRKFLYVWSGWKTIPQQWSETKLSKVRFSGSLLALKILRWKKNYQH